MDQTTRLALPLLAAAQAQKHITHNEALLRLDVIVQLAIADRDLATPPASPPAGARYIVAAGAAGDWAGQSGRVASLDDGVWSFATPAAGWLAWIIDEGRFVVHDGTGWTVAPANVDPVDRVGVSTSADATNRLSVSSPATLLTHAGAGHQVKINKAAAADTASLLYQTAFSGRAELGLTGDDDLHVKVSADGSTWTEALVIARNGGRATFAGPVKVPSFTVAGAPSAAGAGAGAQIYVTNASGGACLAVSDGASWRRVSLGTTVS